MKLSKRLMMAAQFVKKDSVVADIGTDHAYLPSWLILSEISRKAVAADIGRGPLLNAKATVEEYGLGDKIKLVLSDGLKSIDLDDIDTVVLAGMGGDLIVNILSAADMHKLKDKHIIAQPQSHEEKVRAFFINNGFKIEGESICRDLRHIYICMSAVYGAEEKYPDYYEYYGELVKNKDELTKEYFENRLFHMNKKSQALKKCGKYEEAQNIQNIITAVCGAMGDRKNEG